jgi:hypothetical protein
MASVINSSTSAGVTITSDTSGVLQLQTASTAALTITAAQNVGIGTASPAQKLDIASKVQINTSNSYGRINIARATDSALALYIQGADNAGTANELSLVNSGGGGAAINITSGDLRFYTGGITTERLRLNDTGALVLQGGTVTANGTGITFPATQSASSDANTLDDYEEGTWTPTDGSGAGLTFSNASGYYVKIGKQVTAWAQVTYPVTANTAVARVASYPFTTANEEPVRGGGMLGYKTVANVSTVLIQSNNTIMDFRDSTGNVVTNASISNGNFYFTFTYYTA